MIARNYSLRRINTNFSLLLGPWSLSLILVPCKIIETESHGRENVT